MTQIVLTPEQTALLRGSDDPIVLLDAGGQPLGQVSRGGGFVFSSARIAEAKRRIQAESGGITTVELLKKLESLGGALHCKLAPLYRAPTDRDLAGV